MSASRLQPPQHLIHLVGRHALIERLYAGLPRALTLLHAPAGHGKTTLLSQWWEQLATAGIARTWLTLDPSDEGSALVDSIRHALSESGLDVSQLSASSVQSIHEPSPRLALNNLLLELDRIDHPIVLILDDYHLAQSAETDALLDLMLRGLPERMHVIVATRVRPGLALPTLRAQGQVDEIGIDALRFTEQEARELLGPGIDDGDIAALTRRTEGWPIALQLAGFWVREQNDVHTLVHRFSGTVDDMADYLAQQVLVNLPDELRDFLSETSILDRIDAGIADVVRGRTDSHRLLDQLKRYNVLLLPVDRERRAFRHHHLLREFLIVQSASLGAKRLRELNAAASHWFEETGDPVHAVRHAIAAGERDRAASLVEAACSIKAWLTDSARIRTLLDLLSPAQIEASCRLLLASTTVLFKTGNLAAGQRELDRVRAMIGAGRVDAADAAGLHHEVLFIETLHAVYQDIPVSAEQEAALEATPASAYSHDVWFQGLRHNLLCLVRLRRGELAAAKVSVHQAISRFHEADSIYGRLFMHIHLGTVALHQGLLSEATNALLTAEDIALRYFAGHATLVALPQILLSEIAYEQNNVTRATELLQENLAILEVSEGWPEVQISAYTVATALALASGDGAAAEALLDRGIRLAAERGLPRLDHAMRVRRASLLVSERRFEEARALLAEIGYAELTPLTWSEHHAVAITRGQLLLESGQPAAALPILAGIVETARAREHMRSLVRAMAFEALAHHALGDLDRAVTLLLDAIELAQPEGFRRLFVDGGMPMMELLREVARRIGPASLPAVTVDHLTDLLAGFGDLRRSSEKARLMLLLTNREQQILRELARGSSNKVIGRGLALSENAIKFHLKNIYRKLGVVSRVMAVMVAQKLDLLS